MPELCDNSSHQAWTHSVVFLQQEAQTINKLLPRAGNYPANPQIPVDAAFVQRNARESLQLLNLSHDPLNIYAHIYF